MNWRDGTDIAGVYSTSSSFLKKGSTTEQGTQIDLLLDRKDGVINLFEMNPDSYRDYNKEFTISKSYAQTLKQKMDIFEETSKTRKQLFWTMVTTFGLQHNEHSQNKKSNLMLRTKQAMTKRT